MRLIAIALLSLGSLFSSFAGAQELPGVVGRVAYVEGNVALYQDPEVGWDQAYVNSPVTSQNSLWTDPGARAELRLAGVAVRFDGSTQLDMSRLDDRSLDAFVVQGSVALRLRYVDRGQAIEFSTPHGRVAVTAVGRYRIDVDPARDETLVTVFSGAASLRSANGDVRVNAGEAIRIYGGADPSYEREPARTAAIDRWAQDRDAAWVEREATRYVSTNMTGYEDLDRYGQWADEPGFGALWYPASVGGDWVPYRDGHWAWVRPWGWTWVAQEPWGYAPYHYGRWVRVRDRWAWTPGQRVDRPVWAPALVGWIGGGNFSATVGNRSAPAVGWYPLAPWERYQPWYRADANHVNRVNVIVRNEPPRQWRDAARLPQNTDWRTYNRFAGSTVVQREALGQRGNMAKQIVPLNRDVISHAPSVSPATLVPHEEFVRRREQRQGGERQNAGPPVAAPSRDAPRGAPQPSGEKIPTTAPGAPMVPPAMGNPPARDNRPRFEREMTVAPPQPSQRRPGQERGSVPGQDRGFPVAPPSPVQPQGQPPMPPAQGTPLLRPSQDDRRRGEEDRQRGNLPQRQDPQRAAEQQRQDQQRAAEQQRQDQQRAADQARQGQEQQRAAETQRQQQEQQRAGEQQRQVQQRAAEQQRAMEQQRQQQEQQRAGEQQRQQQQRAAEQQRAMEQQRQQQEQQRAGEQQRQQQQRAAEQARQAQEQQRQQGEQQRQQQQQQQLQQQQQQAAQRAAEQQRQQQQQQQLQQQQQQAAQRAAEQQRQQQQQVQQQQQQAAQRAAEAQRQAQERAAQQRPQPQAAPPAPPQGAPAPQPQRPEREGRGTGEDRGKGRDDENPGRGR